MIKTWIRHFIYDISIGVFFTELYQNFVLPSMDLSRITVLLDDLKSRGHINGYTISYDPDTDQTVFSIDVPDPIVRVALQHLIDRMRTVNNND